MEPRLRRCVERAVVDVSRSSVPQADAPTSKQELFELKPVADGVYAAIAAPRYKVNCNAAVIMTNDGVIVVDSHSKPSAALALYREIQSITRQPVKRVINTHFHWDHWQGNQVYKDAFPGLEVISSQRTLENLQGEELTEARVRIVLGAAYVRLRQYNDARFELESAVEVTHARKQPVKEAQALEELVCVAQAASDSALFSSATSRLVALYETNGNPRSAEVRRWIKAGRRHEDA